MLLIADVNAGIAAYSTLAAVLVALGIPVFQSWRRWRRAPWLVVSFGREGPLLTLEPDTISPDRQVLRAAIKNTGDTGTRRARAQITRAWFKAAQNNRADGRVWVPLVEMPIPLVWQNREHIEGPEAEILDFAAGMVGYVPICWRDQRDNLSGEVNYPHHFYGRGVGPNDERLLSRMMNIGEYRVEIGVFSDDADSRTAVVSYEVTLSSHQLVNVERSVVPEVLPAPALGNLAAVLKG